ncbi:MAG: hypothetical protein A3G24_26360 [Betaproteobacteria bacterium RIFCSPLOWO2_12_FULL_62_13]|nr:MAG: hypothetical protein A3G24_26360 [Betaproteobacteria bacterium RIFCSPLOWO2_12_FULL_62_13]
MQDIAEAAGIGVHYRFLEYHDMREVIYNNSKEPISNSSGSWYAASLQSYLSQSARKWSGSSRNSVHEQSGGA